MAKQKTRQFKQKLVRALAKNKKAPVWVVLKTKNRDVMRKKRRQWRHDKMKLRTKHKVREERRTKHKFFCRKK